MMAEIKSGAKKGAEHVVFFLLMVMLAQATYGRNAVWVHGFTLWENSLERSPRKWRPYDKMGVILYKRGQPGRALELFKTALELSPDNFELHNNVGLAYQAMGMADEALGEYRLAAERGSASALLNIGTVYLDAGDLPTALEWFMRAVEKDPQDVPALVNAGFAYGDMKEYDGAMEMHKRALSIDPYHYNAHYGLALAYEGMGMREDSIRHWEEYLRLTPLDEPWRKDALRHIERLRGRDHTQP